MKKQKLLETLKLPDAFAGFTPKPDSQLWGWNGQGPIFGQLIAKTKPKLIIEVGAWMGLSTINMALSVKRAEFTESTVITIDTWLGSQEHWQDPELQKHLELVHGFPTFYQRFLSNAVKADCADNILPLPMTSLIAARYLKGAGIVAELIYIDGSHDTKDVYDDMESYWDLLAGEGVMFGDDWQWDSVAVAVKHFCAAKNLQYKVEGVNWIIQKPTE